VSGTALITGGAGFIGSHLAEALLDCGWAVEVVDNLSTGTIRNIDHLRDRPAFRCTIGSARNRALMAPLVDRCDVVFHLAAAVGVRLIIQQPVRTIETNIRATELVLHLAAKKQRPVVFTSTSEVYGKLDRHLFLEDDNLVLGPTTRPRWCYAASKIIDEFLALAYARERGLPVTVLRLFNTIGPRQTGQYGMVVPRFVQQALEGRPITVYGDGSQRRSFTWVGDVVGAMIALVRHPGAAGEVFNVGHVEDIAIGDLAALVRRIAGSESPIEFVPFEDAYEVGFEDMHRRLPDISKLNRLIGYRPTFDLPQMLERIVAYYRARLSAAVAATSPGRPTTRALSRGRRGRRSSSRTVRRARPSVRD
jgi:UDP-glucose 4-epimerase